MSSSALFGTAAIVTAAAGLALWDGAASRTSPSPHIVPIDMHALSSTSASAIEDTDFWKVIGGERPDAANLTLFVSADQAFEAGISRYDQVTLELREWPVDEFMYIVEGRVEITPEKGEPRIFGPGDAFVMPKGFNGTWRQLSDLRKIQVMSR